MLTIMNQPTDLTALLLTSRRWLDYARCGTAICPGFRSSGR